MDAVRALRDRFFGAGGTETEFEECGRGGLRLDEGAAQDGNARPAEAAAMAKVLKRGVLVEYHCYDNRGRPQGVAVVRFERWEKEADLKFAGEHLAASDPYYGHWAENNLDLDRARYHLCLTARNRCRVNDGRGHETLHLTKWRLVSPQALLGGGYAADAALGHLQKGLDEILGARHAPPQGGFPPAPPVVPPRSGLDAAVGALGDPGEAGDFDVDLGRLARDAHRGRGAEAGAPRSPRRGRPGFGQLLAEKAKEYASGSGAKRRKKDSSRKGRRPDEAEEMRRQKGRGIDEKSESDAGSSSGGEPDFRQASSREVDLDRMSRRDPGCLLRSALREMNKYLAARGEANLEEQMQGRILSYLHQILLPQFPKTGLRAQRELVTLATAMDSLVEGDLGRSGDILAQRFKAIEAALAAEGNWAVARHHEIIPTAATLSTPAEQTQAAKAEIRAQKLRQQISKAPK